MKRGTVAGTVVVALLAVGCGGACTATPQSPASTVTALGGAFDSTAPPGAATRVVLPDPALTPGEVLPVGSAEICVPGYASRARDVTIETKDAVYAEYGIGHHVTGEYEVDHLIPLELGGSNDVKNLWPQPAEPLPGYHEKDELENRLHDLVCAGRLDLAAAQRAIATNWYAAYVTYVLGR